MAPGTYKKMKRCRGENSGFRHREGCSKPQVDIRLPGTGEKIYRTMDNDESARRFVKLAYLYIDGEKAFPPNHPDLPHLKAFRKQEFGAFIWEEFQRHDATELLQDSEDGIDHGNRVGPIMAICAPESSCGHIEVEPNLQNSGLPQKFGRGGGSRVGVMSLEDSPQAGDAQLNSRGLRPEQNYAMLQHMLREVERKEQQVEREKRELEHEKQEVEREKQRLADTLCAFLQEQRGARQGVAPKGGPRRRRAGSKSGLLGLTLLPCSHSYYYCCVTWTDDVLHLGVHILLDCGTCSS